MNKKSYIVQNIEKGVWKIPAGSNIYLIRLDENIIIDAGDRQFRREAGFIERIMDTRDVNTVIFTHLHHDHIGNFDLFSNAKFYASQEAISSFKQDPEGTTGSKDMAEKFKRIIDKVKPIERFKHKDLEIIMTPGHTRGSICIYYKEKKILFSGDTIFENRVIGRIDFPTSAPEAMKQSLMKLIEYPFKILCPGHD